MGDPGQNPVKPKKDHPGRRALAAGGQKNAEGLGAAGAVILAWALTTFAGIDPGPEVTIALGTVIGAITARIKG